MVENIKMGVKNPHLNLNFGDSYIESSPSREDEEDSRMDSFDSGKFTHNPELDN